MQVELGDDSMYPVAIVGSIVDVFLTSECIHLYILYCIPMFLSRESFVFHCTPMFLSGESLI